MSSNNKALAHRIATSLKEPNVELVEKVVDVAGPEKSAKIFMKAAKLYKSGFTIADGSRRRTPGGCFFFVAKGALRRKQRLQVGIYVEIEREAMARLQEQGYSAEEAAQFLADKSQELSRNQFRYLIDQLVGKIPQETSDVGTLEC